MQRVSWKKNWEHFNIPLWLCEYLNYLTSSFGFCSTNDAVLEEMKREYMLQQDGKGSAGDV